MTLQWNKCVTGPWCGLLNVDLKHSHFNGMEGVYIIWHGGPNPWTVRVGQGVIRDRTKEHQSNRAVLAFQQHGLYVSWASVPKASRNGVERFLAETLQPKVGAAFPDVLPIPVNLPWQ